MSWIKSWATFYPGKPGGVAPHAKASLRINATYLFGLKLRHLCNRFNFKPIDNIFIAFYVWLALLGIRTWELRSLLCKYNH